MELIKDTVESAALDSASVLLLRDGPDGLEVFLHKRHSANDVLGGAYVFPGGKVDPADAQWATRGDLPVDRLHAALGEPDLDLPRAASLYVTAIREVFEETGVLFAEVEAAQARTLWPALRSGAGFDQVVGQLGARLAMSRLQPWSRWVTPTRPNVSRKRFDTRFFVAEVPAGQDPGHDSHEAVESVWLRPQAALRQYWAHEIDLAPPQILGLAHLARHASVQGVVAEARGRRPPCIRPHSLDIEGQRVVCYPGDPLHPESVQCLPGPTRLRWHNGHFEPEAGLAILLGE